MTLGRLHLFGLSLAVGTMGLYWFYGRVFLFVPRWIILAVLLMPWLIIHTITFCNAPPFGPIPFRRCLLGAVCAYASLAVMAEVIQFACQFPPYGAFSLVLARVFVGIGVLGCIPIARAYRELREF